MKCSWCWHPAPHGHPCPREIVTKPKGKPEPCPCQKDNPAWKPMPHNDLSHKTGIGPSVDRTGESWMNKG